MEGFKNSQQLKFSIVIPTYNESDDVRLSIESAIGQKYPNKEILVVDDSTDETPQIIKSYGQQGVIYLRGEKKGCCGARNLGIQQASGDVVVLLNADVSLAADFLWRIKKHYDNGADYVLVESEVLNQNDMFARFIEMRHRWEYRSREDIEWTEGFSCRRQAALQVGGIPGDFKITFCRDWLLGRALNQAGFKKVIDRSIVVRHKAPATFQEYWRVRKARGRFGALGQYYIWQRSLPFLFFKFLVKDLVFLLHFLTVIPALLRVFRISYFSKKPLKDFFLFFFAYGVQEIARVIGEWQGWLIIINRKLYHYD